MLNAEGAQYEGFRQAGVDQYSDSDPYLILPFRGEDVPWWYRTPYAFGVVYADGDGRRIFYNQHVLPEDPVDMVDGNPNVRPVEIGGHSGAVFTDPKGITFNLLIWTDGAYFYTLDGTADGETLIRMAESLRGSPASDENGREEERS